MTTPSRTSHLLAASYLAAVAASMSVVPASATESAQPPVYLWGFQHGCDRLSDIDRVVEKEMCAQKGKDRVALLSSSSGKPLPWCRGDKCGEAVRKECSDATGWLLGGQVVQAKNATQIRLWLYDLSNGQIAYQDDYCQNCTLLAALPIQARHLIENPIFGLAPGKKPSYCLQPANRAATLGPVFVSVYGDGRQKPVLSAALLELRDPLGRPLLPAPSDAKSKTPDVQTIVAGSQNARVLMVDAQKDGRVALYVFDQNTKLTDGGQLNCDSCDGENLSARVKEEAATLLTRCFGVQCASSAMGQPPAEACEPFPESKCGGLNEILPSSRPASGAQDRLTPRTAKIIKGLVWGGFTASALAGIGLFVANSTEAGIVHDPPGLFVHDALWRPAWTAAGISLGLAGLAIPITVFVDRATTKAQGPGPAPVIPRDRWIQCPQ